MESEFIWWGTVILILVIFLPSFINHQRKQNKDKNRHKEAQRLGATRAIAQHPQIDQLKCIGCGACVDACPEGGVLGVVGGKAVIINGLKCVGHGLCAEACPVEGLTVGLGDLSKRDDIPRLSPDGETSIPGLYIAGELGGLALIKNAISQGARVTDAICEKLNGAPSVPDVYDVAVVGAGPAGMSAALRAIEKKKKVVLIDQQGAGGTILQYPRKKLVMTKPVEIPLYGKLTKPEYSKEELLEIWKGLQNKYKPELHVPEKLKTITKENEIFQVTTDVQTYKARSVILALGRRGTPRKLGVPGEERSKVAYKLIDAESYHHNYILVVGGGDSAIEAAMGLARQQGNTVTISYRKEKLFRIKARNEQRLNELLKDKKLRVIYNSQVEEIGEESVVLQTADGRKVLKNDFVFIFAGGVPPFKLLKEIGISFSG